MKNFKFIPCIVTTANVMFDTLEKAEQFIEFAEKNPEFELCKLSKCSPTQTDGVYVVNVKKCTESLYTYTASVISSHIEEDIHLHYSFSGFPYYEQETKDWEILEEVDYVKIIACCHICGKPTDIVFTYDYFINMVKSVAESDETNKEFRFMCDDCYNTSLT